MRDRAFPLACMVCAQSQTRKDARATKQFGAGLDATPAESAAVATAIRLRWYAGDAPDQPLQPPRNVVQSASGGDRAPCRQASPFLVCNRFREAPGKIVRPAAEAVRNEGDASSGAAHDPRTAMPVIRTSER
jgi:hypothetical protein